MVRGTLGVLACVAAALAAGCGSGGTGGAAPAADPAAEVMRVDARLNAITFPKGRDEARLRAVLTEVNAIDVSRCPADYRAAYVQFAAATGALVDFIVETGSWQHSVSTGVESFVRGFTMTDPFATVREARERRRQLQARITEANATYQRTLAKYRR